MCTNGGEISPLYSKEKSSFNPQSLPFIEWVITCRLFIVPDRKSGPRQTMNSDTGEGRWYDGQSHSPKRPWRVPRSEPYHGKKTTEDERKSGETRRVRPPLMNEERIPWNDVTRDRGEGYSITSPWSVDSYNKDFILRYLRFISGFQRGSSHELRTLFRTCSKNLSKNLRNDERFI